VSRNKYLAGAAMKRAVSAMNYRQRDQCKGKPPLGRLPIEVQRIFAMDPNPPPIKVSAEWPRVTLCRSGILIKMYPAIELDSKNVVPLRGNEVVS